MRQPRQAGGAKRLTLAGTSYLDILLSNSNNAMDFADG